ncbi:MAG: hypothetical protein ABI395_09115, partial [Sphingobium sp.]
DQSSFLPGGVGAGDPGGTEFLVTIALSVRDVDLLWRMAATHALSIAGLEQEDVEDVIGVLEDPSIADCLAMLLVPKPVAGCVITSFSVASATRVPRRKPAKGGSAVMPLTLAEVARPIPR